MNDPGLFAAIASLSGLSHDDRDSGRQVCVESRIRAGCWGIRYGNTLRLVVELVATLTIWRSRQSVIEKNRAIARCQAHSSQRGKIGWISVAVSGRISDCRRGDGPEIGEAGSLICRHASAEQIRDCDGGNDENDGDHNQQL